MHVKLNGNIVDFAGFELPVDYGSILEEHKCVRERVGLFDVSHMGELTVKGKDAESALNAIVTNDIRGMYDGQVRYSLLPNEKGGAVDDILIYRKAQDDFLIVVNASNTAKDAKWFETHLPSGDYKFENISDKVAQIAIQGPMGEAVLKKIIADEFIPKKYYSFIDNVDFGGINSLVSRTGYTGEDGFEIYVKNADAETAYEMMLNAGKEFNIMPCGLGARDTLRLEAAMPLYGHELGEDIPVAEVGLDFAIKLGKENFVGKEAILNCKKEYVRVGAFALKGIVREHSDVYVGDEKVGTVTSGTFAPTLKKAVCMLRIKADAVGKNLEADVRGRRVALSVTPLPFYKRAK